MLKLKLTNGLENRIWSTNETPVNVDCQRHYSFPMENEFFRRLRMKVLMIIISRDERLIAPTMDKSIETP